MRVSRSDAVMLLLESGDVAGVSEKEFLAAVVRLAVKNGWTHCYHTFDSRRSSAGFPDLVLARELTAGRAEVVAAELKAGKNKPTEPQLSWLRVFRLAGLGGHLWYPRDWRGIKAVLAKPSADAPGRKRRA